MFVELTIELRIELIGRVWFETKIKSIIIILRREKLLHAVNLFQQQGSSRLCVTQLFLSFGYYCALYR